jgi:hypothetical protein
MPDSAKESQKSHPSQIRPHGLLSRPQFAAIATTLSSRTLTWKCYQYQAVITKSLIGLERVKGIEPSYSAWKAAALPLSYTRDFNSLSCFSTDRWHVSGTEIWAVLAESA